MIMHPSIFPTAIFAAVGLWLVGGDAAGQESVPVASRQPSISTSLIGGLTSWDDGMAEMGYYRASDVIYGKPRSYTRVVIVNRQWQGRESGVKVAPDDLDAVPVLKLNIAEEIPTENYNYRFLTTLFVERASLDPVKMVASSQEWCGTTYKHLRWQGPDLNVQSFSYFPGEGDQTWRVSADAVAYEALMLLARDVAAEGHSRPLRVLAPMRSTHAVAPEARLGMLQAGPVEMSAVAAGSFAARRVDLHWDGPRTHFTVEAAPPHRLLAYQMGEAQGELSFTERRAYWDRNWGSGAYKRDAAP